MFSLSILSFKIAFSVLQIFFFSIFVTKLLNDSKYPFSLDQFSKSVILILVQTVLIIYFICSKWYIDVSAFHYMCWMLSSLSWNNNRKINIKRVQQVKTHRLISLFYLFFFFFIFETFVDQCNCYCCFVYLCVYFFKWWFCVFKTVWNVTTTFKFMVFGEWTISIKTYHEPNRVTAVKYTEKQP